MLASDLKYEVVIEERRQSKDPTGKTQESWVFLKRTKASKWSTTGGAQYLPEGTVAFTQDVFEIPYDSRVDYNCRLILNNNYYQIQHIEEDYNKMHLRIKCIVFERSNIR